MYQQCWTAYLFFNINNKMDQDREPEQSAVKRPPQHRQSEPYLNKSGRKRQKRLKQNPFDDIKLYDESDEKNKQENKPVQQWIKPKLTPLTISVCDHSKINKYYSHKSLQKYVKYFFVKNCPNPLWLSVKRQSQIEYIVFIDIQIQNNLFYNAFNNVSNTDDNILNFLTKYNKPSLKAIFKQSPFLKQSSQIWDALFVYDHQAIKQQSQSMARTEDLPQHLTQQILKNYQTYILNQSQRRYNLYPMPDLPVYKEYYRIESKQTSDFDIPLKNKILVIDCEMVMNGNSFELARTSIMNFQGELIYDQFFKPDTITNYNTQFSGITEETLRNVDKKIVDLHKDLEKIISKDTILVGHSLQNDLHAMKLLHQRVIDTSVLYARRNGSKMKLKTLAYQILKRSIQVGSHCSEQDCQATLQLMRHKIEGEQEVQLLQNKVYHLLDELKQVDKKIVMIDPDLQFIKHRKQYNGIQYEQTEINPQSRDKYISRFAKYFQKNIKNADIIFSRIRKTNEEEWQSYYKGIDQTIQSIYQKSLNRTVFFLNFQVNNSYEIYPQDPETLLQRKRPFSLIVVKDG